MVHISYANALRRTSNLRQYNVTVYMYTVTQRVMHYGDCTVLIRAITPMKNQVFE